MTALSHIYGDIASLTRDIGLISIKSSEFLSYNNQFMGNLSTSSNYQNSSTVMFDAIAPNNTPNIFCSTTLLSTGDGSLSGSDIIYLTNPGTYRIDTAFGLRRSNNGHMHFAHWLTYNGSTSNVFLVNFPSNPDFISVNTASYIKLPQSNSTLQVHYNFEAHQCYLESSRSILAPVSYSSAVASIAYIGTYT